jgi:transcriptional regulator with XRE-family HTH domain
VENVGKKIKFYRNQKGFTQEEMAEKLNISFQSYSKIERNITDVNISRLFQRAKILNVSIKDFFDQKSRTENDADNQYLKVLAIKNEEIIKLQKHLISVLAKKTS